MAHLVETHLQMTERAGARQVRDASIALLHGDGGVLSSCQHVLGAGAMSESVDWTAGHEAILYQSCESCGTAQYFRRAFCAACGGADVVEKRASGEGTVYATSLVCRAATAETR